MMITGKTLFAFVDLQDPFVASGVAGEDQTGPILSLMAARPFDFLFLFHTRHTLTNASETSREVEGKYPKCKVMLHQMPDSDPKDVSSLIRQLSRQVDKGMRMSGKSENHVCMSSGTAEMRAALFFLVAAGVLPATLLQVGAPAERLFGGPNVKEVRLDAPEGSSLRDLVVPRRSSRPPDILYQRKLLEAEPAPVPADQSPELEDALKELQICINSAKMRTAAETIELAAPEDVPILLLGETGTGKELFAKLVHRLSGRRNRDFVPINCAAIPKHLAEDILFGHVKGAFTDARNDVKGTFEEADKGTLFLDEIGELSPEVQAKLLRVVQEGEVVRLGAQKARKVDVRIVAATNLNLQRGMADGRFRQDLYFRLKGIAVSLSPLRERREEIPQLALALLDRLNQKFRHEKILAKDSLARLKQHSWPGNVRELQGVLQESVLMAQRDVIEPEDLMIDMRAPEQEYLDWLPAPGPGFDLKTILGTVKARHVRTALSMSNDNQSQAAKLLGISKQALNEFLNNADDRPA